jgi:hypothetical protein
MTHREPPYEEDYSTCAYTHVWLRIMHEAVDPDEISSLLGVVPTTTQRRGDKVDGTSKSRKHGGWILSSKGHFESKDARTHLDWIIAQVEGKNDAFAHFRARGYLVDVCVRWDSLSGHGGPTVSPKQMHALAELDNDLWFDVYFTPDDE